MRMAMAWTVPGALLCVWAAAAGAQERPRVELGADARTAVNVTIYNSSLALVREVRTVELPRGVSAVHFGDVASTIRPETVLVREAGGGSSFQVLEQNYKYDVLTSTRLMELYVDRELTLVSVNPATGAEQRRPATLRSYQDYNPVYEMEGGITFGVDGRVVFPEVPANFVARPTLEWLLDSREAGRREVETLYMAASMSWNADYVVVLDEADAHADLTGWVTLRNDSGIGFDGVTLQLVAGQVNIVAPTTTAYAYDMPMQAMAAFPAAPMGQPAFAEQGLFEYHLYTLQRPTDLANREQKQIELLGADRVPVEKIFRLEGQSYYYVSQYSGAMENLPVDVYLEFANTEENGLGMPLPAGTMRVYKEGGGGQQFIGEDAIDHTPREEDVKLRIGQAFDVVAERRQTDYEILTDTLYETAWEVKLRNRKSETITVEVREPMAGDWEMLDSSLPFEEESQQLVVFRVTVRPDEEAVLTYRVRTGY